MSEAGDIQEYEAAAVELMDDDGSGRAPVVLESLSHRLLAEFTQAARERKDTEDRWLEDLRQYKGEYAPDVEAKIKNRSKAFVRKTRVKVKTLDSRVADLLFPAGSEKNWSIESTPVPAISPDQRRDIVAAMKAAAQQQAAAMAQAQQQQGMAQQQASQGGMPGGEAPPMMPTPLALTMQAGEAPEPPPEVVDELIKEKAEEAAAAMSKTVEDQLVDSRFKQASLAAVHSGHLYGTGILKGPLVDQKVRTSWRKMPIERPKAGGILDAEGKPMTEKVMRWTMVTEYYRVPYVEFVPLWKWYPDMHSPELDGCRFVFELHDMSAHQLFELAQRPGFEKKKDKILALLNSDKDGRRIEEVRHYKEELKQLGDRLSTTASDGVYDLLERWGYIKGCDLKECGVEVPDDRLQESFFCNIWMLPTGEIIRASLEPLNGYTWPYHLYYFDKDETSIFGEGLAMVMRSDQEMINAATRMILDNAAITSGPQLEVMMDLLAPGQDADVHFPWKVWKRNLSLNRELAAIPAVRPIELKSNLNELAKIVQMFEANADETTAIPRYMSGENATQGAAGTAAGMSMLMAAANIVIKDLISAWDEGITRPFLEAMYHWNMRFNPDDKIKGDFDVKARGTASLVAKEVRARQLNEASQMMANPLDAPYVNRRKLLKLRAEAQEMGDILLTDEEVKANQESEEVQSQKQFQMESQKLELAERAAKIKKMEADVNVAAAAIKKMEAEIPRIIAETVNKRVEAIFAAFQAGGAATANPFVAPAGDEVHRSAGGQDMGGKADLGRLNGPPVQEEAGTHQLLNKGQSFQVQPRGTAEATTPAESVPEQPVPPIMDGSSPADPNTGQRAGIETVAVEGA